MRSWLLVHLLVNRHRLELEAFMGRLGRAEEPRAACCGGLTSAVLGAESSEYLHGGRYTMLTVTLPRRAVPMTARELRRAEILATQAELLADPARAAARVHPDDARPFLLLASSLRREHGAEREAAVERAVALATVRANQGRCRDAVDLEQRALEADVRSCRYSPALQGGKPLAVELELTFSQDR